MPGCDKVDNGIAMGLEGEARTGLTRHKRRKHPAPIESSDEADETDEREDEEIEDAE